MVYLVGAGPGDPGLMTVRALELLKRADVVLYDSLIDPVVLCETHSDCMLVDVGKRAGRHTKSQDETSELLVDYGLRGLEVVRLKGGDPLLFGRGGEEAERLRDAGVPFEIVPGVSALTAATAYAGIPVTHRDSASSLGVATGHGARGKNEDPVRWRNLASAVDTIVVFMGIGGIERITAELLAGGRTPDTPAAVIQNGTLPNQLTVTGPLADIAGRVKETGVEPPALLVVGKTAALSETLGWFRKGPLGGLHIGITRQLRQSASFADRLRQLGARPVLMPVIETVDITDTKDVADVINNIESFDSVVFSSTNGVESFLRALKRYKRDARSLAGTKLACIGPVTAQALESHGILADLVAERYIAEGLAEMLAGHMTVGGSRFLLVRSNLGRDTLKSTLESAGGIVRESLFYITKHAEIQPNTREMILGGAIDMVTFTSSSTVDNFFGQIRQEELPANIVLASIGPQTSDAIRRYGCEPSVEAREYTTAGLAEVIYETYGSCDTGD